MRAVPGSRPPGLLGKEVGFADSNGAIVEIHEYALTESADDSDLWERAEILPLPGAEAWAPGAADMLLHVGAHGMRWNEVQPLSWVVDAAAILRSAGPAFDWERFSSTGRGTAASRPPRWG